MRGLDIDGPPGVVEPLKAAFERKTAPGGGWTGDSSTEVGASAARCFMNEVVAPNPGVTEIGDISAEMWRTWCGPVLSLGKSYISFMRSLLLEVDGLPEPTVEAVRGRRRFTPYSDTEEQAFGDASRLLAESLITRIGGNAEKRARYLAGETPTDEVRVWIAGREWPSGEVLDYVFHHGVEPGSMSHIARRRLRGALKMPPRSRWKAALFPIAGEIAALQFLFVLEGGYNPPSLQGMKVGAFGAERHEDPAALAAEAAAIRLGTPGAAETLQAKRERLHRIAEFIGRPARDWLAARGHPTGALFVAYSHASKSAPARQFTTNWSAPERAFAFKSWSSLTGIRADDGSVPSIVRLRSDGPPVGEIRVPVRGEADDDVRDRDFSDLAYLPSQWIEPLCGAFGRLAGPGGEWRAKDVVLAGSGVLRRVARELPLANPGLTTIDDITKEMWERWRNSVGRGPGDSRAVVDLARSLLQEAGCLVGSDAALSGRLTAATLPDPGWRPTELVGEGGLHGTMPGGDGWTWDFRDIPAPLGIKEPIAAAFARMAGIGGAWKAITTVKTKERCVKRFLESLAFANPDIATIQDVTAEAWWKWLGEGNAGGPPSNSDIGSMRKLLLDIEGLRETTRRALVSHRSSPRKESAVTSYDDKEERALRTAAARDIRKATYLIGTNLDKRDLYRRGEEPADAVRVRIAGKDYSHGALVHHLSFDGKMPGPVGKAQAKAVRDMLGLAKGQYYAEALFLNATEIFSLQMLFVLEGGYNCSTLNDMKIGNFRADDRESDPPVEMREHEKPRRGSRRFFWETLIGDTQKLAELAEWITQPARDALAALGYPTDALWVGIATSQSRHWPRRRFNTDYSKNRWSTARRWLGRTGVADNTGGHPTHQRLRRTHQVIHDKASGHTQETHDTMYVAPDPRTREHARDTIPRLQRRIIGNAREHEHQMRMQVLISSEASVAPLSQDTAVVRCRDISDSPFAERGELCPVSLRTCFQCSNGYMTPDHLPRVLTYMSELKARTRHLSDEEWQDTHAYTYSVLQDAIEQFTEAELNEARGSVTPDDLAVVDALLRLP